MIFTNDQGSYPSAFIDSLIELKKSGRLASPRGQKTLELDHVVFEVDPHKTLFTSPKRNLNFFFLIAENLWYWSGRNSTEIPSYYVSNYRQFSDDGLHQGAYGPMLLEQIRFVVNSLTKDPESRQAVVTLWRPNPSEAKDKPCTISFDFKIRDGKLNMHATMRSNDAIWGSNYDIPSFSMIQIAIAGMLKVPAGKLFLTAHSYHVYEKHFKLMDELISEAWMHNSKYPIDLCLPPAVSGSLEKHMQAIEFLLSIHYACLHNGVPPTIEPMCYRFYDQFIYMIKLFYDKNNESLINDLRDIGSPFGTIYHERYISKK